MTNALESSEITLFCYRQTKRHLRLAFSCKQEASFCSYCMSIYACRLSLYACRLSLYACRLNNWQTYPWGCKYLSESGCLLRQHLKPWLQKKIHAVVQRMPQHLIFLYVGFNTWWSFELDVHVFTIYAPFPRDDSSQWSLRNRYCWRLPEFLAWV